MTNSNRCVVCLDTERHGQDENGVCENCQIIHRDTYDLVLSLVSEVEEAIT